MKVVQIAQLEVSSDPDEVLAATGLGSCVALMLAGTTAAHRPVFGLAHVLLPESEADTRRRGSDPAKFADTAVPALVRATIRGGARRSSLRAAMAGGARMFQFSTFAGRDIGERNAAALQQALAAARIPLDEQDVGGEAGRSVRMIVGEGRVLVRMSRGSQRELLRVQLPVHTTTGDGQADGTRFDRR